MSTTTHPSHDNNGRGNSGPGGGELRTRNLRTVGLLAAIFLLPLFGSFWMYYGTDWRPAGSTAHGDLIQPARPLPATKENLFADFWTLVYVGSGTCDDACRRALLVMRQDRLALNNEMTRVKRLFLSTEACCDQAFLEKEHPGLITIDATAPEWRAVLEQFPADNRANLIFIVDPLGNLMLQFDARENPKGLLTDLKRLLKLSHIG